jgi:ankyrin repeat protein
VSKSSKNWHVERGRNFNSHTHQNIESTICDNYEMNQELSKDFFCNIIKECVSVELTGLKAIELQMLGFAIQTVARYRSPSSAQKTVSAVNYRYGKLYPNVINECLRELILSFSSPSQGVEWLSLHWAASCNSISADDILVLLENDPNSVRTLCSLGPNRSNILPIHLLCATSQPRVEIADILIAAFPFSVMQSTVDGFLPLHYAARYCSSVEFVQFLIQANDKAIRHKTKRRATCLHLAVFNPSHEVFLCILAAYPAAISEIMASDDGSEFTGNPLKLAIRCGNLAAVKAILDVSPGLSRQPFDESQEHPLYYAARCSTLPVVETLLDRDGEMLFTPSGTFLSYPLHGAVNNPDDQILDCLLRRYPDPSQDTRRRTGMPPENSDEEAAVNALVDARGQHVIHALVKSMHLNTHRLQQLLAKFPSMLRIRDRDRNLPLHLLLEAGNSMAEFNNDCSSPNSQGRKRFEAFEYMVRAYPRAVAERNVRNYLPLHQFAYAADSAIGFAVSGAGTTSPARKKTAERIKSGGGGHLLVSMLRQLLKSTQEHADESAIASVTIDDESVYDLMTRHAHLFGDNGGGVRSVCIAHCNGEDMRVAIRWEMERLLLRANPGFDDRLLRNLNYQARRMALFLAFSAGTLNSKSVNIFARLRKVSNGEILACVVSFL